MCQIVSDIFCTCGVLFCVCVCLVLKHWLSWNSFFFFFSTTFTMLAKLLQDFVLRLQWWKWIQLLLRCASLAKNKHKMLAACQHFQMLTQQMMTFLKNGPESFFERFFSSLNPVLMMISFILWWFLKKMTQAINLRWCWNYIYIFIYVYIYCTVYIYYIYIFF